MIAGFSRSRPRFLSQKSLASLSFINCKMQVSPGWRAVCLRHRVSSCARTRTGGLGDGANNSWCTQSAPSWPGWCSALPDLGQVPELCTFHLPAQAEEVHSFPSPSLFKDTDNTPYSLKCRTRQVSVEGRLGWRQPKSLWVFQIHKTPALTPSTPCLFGGPQTIVIKVSLGGPCEARVTCGGVCVWGGENADWEQVSQAGLSAWLPGCQEGHIDLPSSKSAQHLRSSFIGNCSSPCGPRLAWCRRLLPGS